MNESGRDQDLSTLAEFLDSKFRGPFGTRFGWDAILGLIPGFGDTLTNVMAFYIILRAALEEASFSTVLRMILNVMIDNLIDAVPLLGWLGDFAWKANLRNLDLIRRHRNDPVGTQRSSRWVIVLTVGLGLAIVVSLTVLMAGVFFSGILWIAREMGAS